MRKRIVALDFDGVIHSYTSDWQGARNTPDPPVPGVIEWIENFTMDHCIPPEREYRLCIFSSRSRYPGARRAMNKYLIKHGLDPAFLKMIKFPLLKPPAWLIIDDRCICFNGKVEGLTEAVTNFTPWYRR